jgi:serine/threonine-protein kinase
VANRNDEAIEQLRKTIEMDPTFDLTHWFLGQAYENKGQLMKAVAEYEKATQLAPDPAVFASLARAFALAGRKEEARKILANLTSESHRRYIPAYSLAVVHLSLGEKEEALRWLEKSYDDGAPFDTGVFGSIKIDRRLDPLRGEARFEALARKVAGGASAETP